MRKQQRDRHGRGLRGRLLPPSVRAYRTRAQHFDDLVVAYIDQLDEPWKQLVSGIEFAVEEVPPSGPAPWEKGVPLARYFAADTALAPRLVLYRRPLVQRSFDECSLAALIAEVLAEQIAHILGREPGEIDPRYRW